MNKKLLLAALALFMIACVPITLTSASEERAALVALYKATNGADWTNTTNWLSDAPIGDWHGVTADADGRVTQLNLANNRLSGSIPPALRNLDNLTQLHLSFNQLSGTIPIQLGKLTNLTVLDLHVNQLSGTIPPELGNLTYLIVLHLDGNQLSGCVPAVWRDVAYNDLARLGLPCCDTPTSAPEERVALVALYGATNGANWLSDKPLGEWNGVTTDFAGRGYRAGPRVKPVERGDPVRTGQPHQPDVDVSLRQPVARVDPVRVGQVHQPDSAESWW